MGGVGDKQQKLHRHRPQTAQVSKNHMSALCHAHRFLWFPCMGLCRVMPIDLRLCVCSFLAPPCSPPMILIKYHFVVDSCTCNVMYINYRAGAPIYYCNVMAIDFSIFYCHRIAWFHVCAIIGIDYCVAMFRDSIDNLQLLWYT